MDSGSVKFPVSDAVQAVELFLVYTGGTLCLELFVTVIQDSLQSRKRNMFGLYPDKETRPPNPWTDAIVTSIGLPACGLPSEEF